MRRASTSAVVAVALLLGGALPSGQGAPSAAARQARMSYVALGDSLTAGFGLAQPDAQSYPAVLARYLPPGARFANLAIAGITLADALAKELPAALAAQPTLVTVWLGYNDLPDPAALYANHLATLLGALQHSHAQVFVLTLPDPRAVPLTARHEAWLRAFETAEVRAYNRAIGAAAARTHAGVIDVFTLTPTLWRTRGMVQGDGLHLSAAGNALLARLLYRVLHSHQAL